MNVANTFFYPNKKRKALPGDFIKNLGKNSAGAPSKNPHFFGEYILIPYWV